MKIFRFKTIQSRLLFWFIIFTFISLSACIAIIYYLQAESIEQEAYDKLTVIRDLKVARLNSWLTEREGDLKGISTLLSIQEGTEEILNEDRLFEKESIEIEKLRNTLDFYLEDLFDYNEIFIIDADTGIVKISTDKSREGTDRSGDDFFTNPLQSGEFYINDIYYSKILNKPAMAFSIPIFNSEQSREHIIGILVVRVDLDRSFYPFLLSTTGMGKTGETLIVNKDMIAVNELRWRENAPLNLKITALPALLASRGETGIIESVDYRDEKVLGAYTHIPRTGWGFVAKQDLAEIGAPNRKMVNNFIIILMITSIVIYFISRMIASGLAKPLISMVGTSDKIQSGNFTARNEIYSDDEIGYLANSFNKMAVFMESIIKTERGRSEISDIIAPLQKMKDIDPNVINMFMKVTGSDMCAWYVLDEEESKFEHLVSVGIEAALVKSFDAYYREGEFGKAIIEKKISHIKNIPPDTIFKFKTIAGTAIPKEIITVPLIVENQVAAVISMASLKEYPTETMKILESSFYAINFFFSNLLANERRAKLNTEVREKNIKLQSQTEELQSQSEELQSQADELSEQNIELEMQKKQVEEASRLKTEFLSNMSHELRTPLNSIMALSRVLIMQIKDKISSEEGNYLKIIEKNGKNLLALINDILDLSKIEAGKVEINWHTFSLKPIIENIRDNLSPISREKNVEIITNIPDDLPKIQSDSEKLNQILQNIIGNAVKFTEKGSVSINAESDESQVVVKVIDTGIGIKHENLSHIFEEFKQVDASTSRRFEGTGLGLAIASKLADILGIKINAKSELGKGSIFALYLPVKWTGSSDENEETVVLPKSWKLEQEGKGVKESIPGEIEGTEKGKIEKKRQILLVEDNKETIIQVKMVLKEEGYIVDVAEGGKAALDYIEHTIPDGIILDLMMPEIDGFEVLESIRSTSRTANIPVLILTAKSLTREDFKKLSANNVQQLLFKGAIEKDELILKIKLMMGNKIKELKKIDNIEDREIRKDQKVVCPQVKVFPRREGFPTILIAEDNPDNLITLEAILKGKYNLIEAIDGESALYQAKKELPDLILMDLALPKMDGLTVAKFLKDEEVTKNIPVIALTARAMKGDREKVIAAGCNDYIPKPIDPEMMLEKIGEWLEKKGILDK